MSLKNKTIKGFIWSFVQRIASQSINFIVSIVLARILLPEDFGLVSLALVFLAIANIIVDSGLTSSLIRNENSDEKDFSTVFFINLLGGCVIYLLIFVFSPFISASFGGPSLTLILRVLGLIVIVKSFTGVQKARLTKAMDFKTQMIIEMPSLIIGGSIGIWLAILGFGVWSLVWMNLSQAIMSSVQLWIRSKWRPIWYFNRSLFMIHFNFGYKLALSALLNSVYQNIYSLIIGRYFSLSQLGLYNRAESFTMFPVTSISLALNRVAYPLLSSIQNDLLRLKLVYRKLLQQVVFWLAPLLCLAAVLAKPIFIFVLTEKWIEAVPFFQILCVTGIMYPLHDYNLNILKVKGRSDLFLKLEIIKKIFVTVGLVIAIPFGIYGLLYFRVVSSFMSLIVNSFYSGKLIDYPLSEQLIDVGPIFFIAMVTSLAIYLLDNAIGPQYNFPTSALLLFEGMVGAIIYLALAYLFKISALFDIRYLIPHK